MEEKFREVTRRGWFFDGLADTRRSKALFLFLFAAYAVVTGLFEIRPFTDVGERFIGHADQADMAIVARNIAEGKGAVVDCVWFLQGGGLPGNQVTHPEPYWSIYVAAIIAAGFRMLGPGLVSMLFVAWIVKVCIAALGYFWTYHFTKSNLAALVSGVFLLSDASLNGLSDIYLTFFVFAATSLLCLSVFHTSSFAKFACGILVGLAIGAKPTGVLMIGVVGGWILLSPRRLQLMRSSWTLVLGCAVGLAPLLIHSVGAYGFPESGSFWGLLWPLLPLVKSGSALRHSGAVEHYAAFFDPSLPLYQDAPRDAVRLLRDLKRTLEQIVESGQVVPQWFLPFAFVALTQFAAKGVRRKADWTSAWTPFVACTCLLVCGGVLLAANVHFESRYWNFLVPALTVVTVSQCAKFSRLLLFFALIATVVGHADEIWLHRNRPLRPVPAEFEVIEQLVPPDGIIMTPNPCDVSYHTRRRCVMLPYTESAESIQAVASRYGAKYLAIVDRDENRHKLAELTEGKFPPYLKKIEFTPSLVVGKFIEDKNLGK